MVLSLGKDPVTGRRRRKWISVPGGTREDAERRRVELLQQYYSGGLIEPSKVTMATYLRQWHEQYAQVSTSVSTQHLWGRIIETHLIPSIGDIQISDLRPSHVLAYYAEALKSGNKKTGGSLSKNTLAMHHQILNQAMKHAVQWELLSRNVLDVIDRPKGPKFEPSVLDDRAVIRLLEYLEGGRYYMPVYLLIFTGLRRSEVLGLKRIDFNPEAAVLSVRRKLVKREVGGHVYEEVKGRRWHAVDLSPGPVRELIEHRDRQQAVANSLKSLGVTWSENWPICADEDGSPIPPNTLTNRFPTLLQRAGLRRARPHDLRHTHAAQLIAEGVPLVVVGNRLNHASRQTTVDMYGHQVAGAQRDAAERLERRLERAKLQPTGAK